MADTLLSPDRVESFRVHPYTASNYSEKQPDFDTFGMLGEFLITEIGPDLSRTERRTAGRLLADSESYLPWEVAIQKLCLFSPRHGLRFHRGEDVVEVLICFDCSDVSLSDPRTKQSGGGDFSQVEGRLREMFARILPEEPRTSPN